MNMTHIKAVFTPGHAALACEQAGEPYLPSNGTEGACFHEAWCGKCSRDLPMSTGKDYDECTPDEVCQILADSFCGEVKEWVYGKDGYPVCTAFKPAGEPERDDRTLPLFDDAALAPTGDAQGEQA